MKRLMVICLLILVTLNVAQLKKIEGNGFYSEAPIYQDENGTKYSELVRIKFNGKTIDLPKNKKEAIFSDIQVLETKELLMKTAVKYGAFKLEKAFEGSFWGDTIGTHIVTKEKVKLADLSQFYKMKFEKIV